MKKPTSPDQKLNADDLLDSLVSDLKPVKLVAPLSSLFVPCFVVFAALCFGVLLLLSPLRASFERLWAAPIYLGVEIMSLLSFTFLLYTSLRSRQPGLNLKPALLIGWAFLILQILFLAFGFGDFKIGTSFDLGGMLSGGMFCSLRILAMAASVVVAGTLILRRGFVVQAKSAALAVAGGALSLAMWVLPFSCESEGSAHLLISHFLLPLLIIVPILYILKSYLFLTKR